MGTSLLATVANLGLEEKGMIDDFEKAAVHLLVRIPVAKSESFPGNTNNDNLDHESEAEASASSFASRKVPSVNEVTIKML